MRTFYFSVSVVVAGFVFLYFFMREIKIQGNELGFGREVEDWMRGGGHVLSQ